MPFINPLEKDKIKLPETVAAFSAPDIETSLGGIAESAGAGLMAGATFLPQTVVSGIEVLEDITGLNLGGQSMDDVVDNAVEFWRKRIGKTKAERLIGQAMQTVGAIGTTAAIGGLAGIAAGAGTTQVAAAKAGVDATLLLTLSAGAGLEKMAEELEAGAPRLNAYGAGIVQAGTEYLTEKIPIGILQKPGLNFLTRLAAGAISDVPSELLATAIEMKVIDEKILGKEPTPTKEFVDALKETAMVSILSTIALTGGSQVIQSDALKAIQPPSDPRKTVQVEKQETTPDTIMLRDDAKSEFPELQSQTNYPIPDDQLRITSDTKAVPDLEDSPVIETEADLPVNANNGNTVKDNAYAQTLEKSRSLSRKKRGFNGGRIWKSFITSIVDVSGNIKAKLAELGNDGLRVIAHRNAQAGAIPKAHKELDILNQQIYSGLSSDDKLWFDGYRNALRDLELKKRFGAKYVLRDGVTEQQIQDYIRLIPQKYMVEPDGSEGQFIKRSKRFSTAMRNILDLSLKEGILEQNQYDRLVATGEYYLPREVLDYIDPEIQRKNREGKTITVRDSGLKNLSEDGTDKLVETDTAMLLKQTYERAYTRIFKNRANMELLRLAQTQPDNGIVRENKIVGVTKEVYDVTDSAGNVSRVEVKNENDLARLLKGKDVTVKKVRGAVPIFKETAKDEGTIGVMVGGRMRQLVMPLELTQEWVTSDPILSATTANIIGWASGNKMLKSMATTLNPEFAVTNVPKDAAHIYLTTQEYSTVLPLAGLQMANDIRAVVSDSIRSGGIKNTDIYNMYIDNGGGTEFLTYQGVFGLEGTNPISRAIKALEGYMGKAGEYSELLTRLSLMRRAMNNGKSPFEAAQIARGYLDFSQGGSVTKALDSGIPFLNAAVQATRGITRAAKTSPLVFSAKVFQLGTMAMSLYWTNKFMYGDDVDDIPDNEQKNNWNLLLPSTFKDAEGNERRRYIRIPKDQGQRVFTSIFEGMAKKALGEPVDGDQIADAALDFLPFLPTDLPPVIDAILGYAVNKDFWKREDIWSGPEVLPQEEYNVYTPTPYVKFGEATGLSPERFKYAVEQVFTRGNIWTSMVGYGAKQVLDVLDPKDREEAGRMFERQPFIRRVMRSTRPDLKREKDIKAEKIRISTERFRANRQLDELVESESSGRTDTAEINDYIRRYPKHEQDRLRKRLKRLKQLDKVTNKGFWFDLLELPPEQRAVNYWNQWVQLDQQGRTELDRQSRQVPGFRSKRFNKSFIKMHRFGEQGGR